MAAVNYCTPSKIRVMFPNSTVGLTDAQLTASAAAASDIIENYTQRILTAQTYNEEDLLRINRYGEIVVRARQWPILSVSALTYTLIGGISQGLGLYYVDCLRPPDRLFYWTGPITTFNSAGFVNTSYLSREARGVVSFTYTAGYSTIPGDLQMAAVWLALDNLAGDANPTGAQNLSVSGLGTSTSLSFGDNSIHLTKAYAVLDRYVRHD